MNGFQCLKCGDCCRWGGFVYITSDDVSRMREHFSLSEYEFINRYAEIVHRPRLNLKTKESGSCIFQEGNDCEVHSSKPTQCIDFPAIWRIKDIEGLCSGQRKMRRDTERP